MTREGIPIPLDDLEEAHEAVEREKRKMDGSVQGFVDRITAAAERWLSDPEVNAALHRKPTPPDFLDPGAIRKTLS